MCCISPNSVLGGGDRGAMFLFQVNHSILGLYFGSSVDR